MNDLDTYIHTLDRIQLEGRPRSGTRPHSLRTQSQRPKFRQWGRTKERGERLFVDRGHYTARGTVANQRPAGLAQAKTFKSSLPKSYKDAGCYGVCEQKESGPVGAPVPQVV